MAHEDFNPSRFLDEKPPMFQFSGSVFGFNGSNMERLQIMGIIQMWSTDFFGECVMSESWQLNQHGFNN